MEKINKLFKGMYIAMGIAGVIMAVLSLVIGFKDDIFTQNIYGTLLIVLSSLAIITMLSALFNNTIFENADKLKLTVIRGHIAVYFGFASYFIILANDNNTAITTTLLILAIFTVYIVAMVFMFFWLIQRIQSRFIESEKEKIDG